jgi:hypothetical protein
MRSLPCSELRECCSVALVPSANESGDRGELTQQSSAVLICYASSMNALHAIIERFRKGFTHGICNGVAGR